MGEATYSTFSAVSNSESANSSPYSHGRPMLTTRHEKLTLTSQAAMSLEKSLQSG